MNFLQKTAPMLTDAKKFACIVGAVFFVGVISMSITKMAYAWLMMKVEGYLKRNSKSQSKTLKQIVMKYETSIRINGNVINPTAMINRYLYRYRFMGFTLNALNHIADFCALMCVVAGCIGGAAIYVTGGENVWIVGYIMFGTFAAFALEIMCKWADTEYSHRVLVNAILDLLENVIAPKAYRTQTATLEIQKESEDETAISSEDGQENIVNYNNNAQREKLINEILNEFFQ
ncbi:MAG: hypothetical protein ACI4DS_06965 [Eubacterium sp.]